MEFYIGQTYINITDKNIHIHNSYLIRKLAGKELILKQIYELVPNYPRSYKSALREWKVHNILHKLHIFRKSTAHTDIEAKPLFIVRLFYFLVSWLDFIE